MKARNVFRFALALAFAATAVSTGALAEKKKVQGSNVPQQGLSEAKTSPGDKPGHELAQNVRNDKTTSSNPDWNDTVLTIYEQTDTTAGSGTHRGTGVHHHKNGDKSYFQFDGSGTMTAKDGGDWNLASEGKFEWTGGTGKFQKLKGNGTYSCKFSPKGGQCDWQGEADY